MINQDEHTPICIHLNGPAFEHNNNMLQVDLFSFSQSLMDIQSMFDRSYVVLGDTSRVTTKNRKEFKLIANNFKPSSLEIEAMLSVIPTMIPLIVEYIPTAYRVIETTIKAFELGKKLRGWLNSGQYIT
ncbi:MAG: hypothetical protein H6Q69_3182 [Firmicutes bacterium]|nr:hypothetical protein [Bacillota bacterium]